MRLSFIYAALAAGAGAGIGRGRGRVHSYRVAGSRRSRSGTATDHMASDQSSPLVRNSRNWMYQAVDATSAANRIRPARESGVVLGSEIMKKLKSRNAPLSRRWNGIVSGSPR